MRKHHMNKKLSGILALAIFQTLSIAQAADVVDEVVVTGSRIRRDPTEQPAPITAVDEADIQRTGLTSIADVLHRLPGTTGGIGTRSNRSGNSGNPPDGGGVGAGSSEIDIRYLGSRRTLVLLDGQRFINGTAASGVPAAVDLNAIPDSMIERVEVLRDGASAIYGSDAIAGVINIITKKKQEGFEASAQGGIYDEGDGATELYNLSYGSTLESTGTSFVVGGNYAHQGPIYRGDRELYYFPTPGAKTCDTRCSASTPSGRFQVDNPITGQAMDLTLKAPVPLGTATRFDAANPTGPNSDYKQFTNTDRYNTNPLNYLLTPYERIGGFVTVEQPLWGNTKLSFKGIVNQRKSSNQAAPEPIVVGPDAGNGNLLDRISIDVTNPYNPFGFTLDAGGVGGAGSTYSFIGRRLIENGPRHFDQDVKTAYGNLGLSGDFDALGKSWFWDVSGIYAKNKATQVMHGNVHAGNLAQALGPVANCTAPCVPFNIFGGNGGSVTKEMLDFVTFVQDDESEQTMADMQANISGTLFELPAGPLGIAAGYEWRKLKGSFTPDPVVAAGLGSDIPAQPTAGEQSVSEVYTELSIPLLKDIPGISLLEGSFAVRYFDYTDSGSDSTMKAGLSWKPIEDLRIRGTWAEGFRAPSIGELYGSPSRFDGGVIDPCSSFNTNGASATAKANCIAQGVPADGSYTQINATLPIITGGNRALNPETSTSYVFGFAYSPSWAADLNWMQSLTLEADHYQIKIDDAIASVSADVLMKNCANFGDALSCSAITRSVTGAVTQIRGVLQNVASIESSGLDVTLTYRSPVTSWGSFGVSWSGTFLDEYKSVLPGSNGPVVVKNKGIYTGGQSYPEQRGQVELTWQRENVFGSLTNRYISAITEPSFANHEMGSTIFTDIQVGWAPEMFNDKLSLTLGVNNVLGKTPPICLTCGGFDSTLYDTMGQFAYLRVAYKE